MAPRTDEQREKNRVAQQARRDKLKLMAETNKKSARKIKRQRADETAMAASMVRVEEYELVPAPMQAPVRVASRWNQPRRQQGVQEPSAACVAAIERSLERKHEADRELYTMANNAMTQVNNIMTLVARCHKESSARETDFRSLLSSCTEHTLASGDHQ
jgi:hypothetical protein